eukprot:scaffold56242_cov32-Attheya_sp.AAC.1
MEIEKHITNIFISYTGPMVIHYFSSHHHMLKPFYYLYAWTEKGWTRHSPTRLGMTQKHEKNGQTSEKPYRPYPATPKIGANAYMCHHSYSSSTNTSKPRKYDSHGISVNTLHKTHKRGKSTPTKRLRRIERKQHVLGAENFKLGKDIYLVTDGGDTDGNGYFGWVVLGIRLEATR